MEVAIKNGSNGDVALVDKNRRLHTETIIQEQSDHACDTGIEQKYNVNTGDITINNATKLTTLYMKNTGADDLVITALIYNLGNSASGSGDAKIDVIRNPTTGDIIDNTNNVLAGAGEEANQNFGSSNTLTGNFYKGAVGETAVNGSVTITTRTASHTGRIPLALGAITIPKGKSIAIDYTPPTSNTSQIVQFAAACFVRTSEVTVGDIK